MPPETTNRVIADLVYVSFAKHVVALDRYTGETVWTWTAPKGGGYIVVMVDGDRLIVSANGYMYCLDPLFGQLVWSNPLTGMGVGVPCIASVNGNTISSSTVAAAAADAAQKRAAAGST
jgi:outer membrane protein assembly factor BamB